MLAATAGTFLLATSVSEAWHEDGDLFVARQRFVAEAFINRLIGLPLYYAGQLLIAWSTLTSPN